MRRRLRRSSEVPRAGRLPVTHLCLVGQVGGVRPAPLTDSGKETHVEAAFRGELKRDVRAGVCAKESDPGGGETPSHSLLGEGRRRPVVMAARPDPVLTEVWPCCRVVRVGTSQSHEVSPYRAQSSRSSRSAQAHKSVTASLRRSLCRCRT